MTQGFKKDKEKYTRTSLLSHMSLKSKGSLCFARDEEKEKCCVPAQNKTTKRKNGTFQVPK
jgi:hypothetical protein